MTVQAQACDLHVGSLDTGRSYVNSTSTFWGTLLDSRVTWTAATNTLTVHIGIQKSGLKSLSAQQPATVTYTPDPAMQDLDGFPIDPAGFQEHNQRF